MTNIKDGVIRESSMGYDHPIVWTNCVGKGKAFYSAMGHKGKYFLEPLHLEVIKSGIVWAADKTAKCNKFQSKIIFTQHKSCSYCLSYHCDDNFNVSFGFK